MNFQESEEYLLSLGNEVAAMKLGLESIRTLLKSLGEPQTKYLKVQVAGTNGKGSVCAFLDSICRAALLNVGLYTSPHLVSITERIRINGEDIGEDKFASLATRVRETSEGLVAAGDLPSIPTFFEQVTAIALLAFAEAGVELAILETGLGGRLDAATAANAEICAITRTDLDHQQYLGETIEDIAGEKAAIIHKGSKAFIGEQPAGATQVILDHCAVVGVKPEFADFVTVDERDGGYIFTTAACDYEVEKIGLKGRHQMQNVKLALLVGEELARRFSIAKGHITRGIERATHPGRLEYQGKYLFDGAHNLGGAKALAAFLNESEQRPITIVFAAMEDKPISQMLNLLVPRAHRVVFTQPSNERSASYEKLLESMPAEATRERTFITDSVENAIDIAEAVTPAEGVTLVTGSLYLIGEVKKLLGQRSQI